MFKRFLFPNYPYSVRTDWILLISRIIFAAMLLTHGIYKWNNFDTLEHTFANPIGLGSEVSLILVMFAETACCVAVAFGFLWRLSIIPILIDLVVLVFVVSAHATFGNKELPLLYLVVYIILYFTGPGKYSIDGWIEKRIYRDKK